MDYVLWIYNRITDIQYGLYAIEIFSRSRFEPVPETLNNCHVCVFTTYIWNENCISLDSSKYNIPNNNWEESKGGSMYELLGINIKTLYDGIFQFYQSGLVKKI